MPPNNGLQSDATYNRWMNGRLYDCCRNLSDEERKRDAGAFFRGTKPINNERHLHYFNLVAQYTIRPARSGASPHDPYSPGLHHICFRVPAPADVDAAAKALRQAGVMVTDPAFHPGYAPDYYATFFSDPDGIRLEIVAHRRLRSLIRDKWHELKEFEDPLTKAGLI